MANELYTKSFNENFDRQDCIAYDNKFSDSFRKNIKHLQQVRLLKGLMRQAASTTWLDFPAGSGRLIKELRAVNSQKVFAYDKSKEFLNHLRESYPDIEVHEADLFTECLETGRYDCITCFHTLFAFSRGDQAAIIANLSRGLGPRGILVFDVSKKKRSFQASNIVNSLVNTDNLFSIEELKTLLSSLGLEITVLKHHDFIDGSWPEEQGVTLRYVEKVLNLLYRVPFARELMILIESAVPARFKYKFIVVASRS